MPPLKSVAVPIKARGSSRTPERPEGDSEEPSGLGPLRTMQPRAVTARPAHRYRVGQRLLVAGGGQSLSRAGGTATVVSRLPHEGGPLLYRVKIDSESHERIVAEADLTLP